jgi:hypothetical protein
MKNVENKSVYYKTVEYQHLIFWPGSWQRVQCHAVKLEPNQRVTNDQVPLLWKHVLRMGGGWNWLRIMSKGRLWY